MCTRIGVRSRVISFRNRLSRRETTERAESRNEGKKESAEEEGERRERRVGKCRRRENCEKPPASRICSGEKVSRLQRGRNSAATIPPQQREVGSFSLTSSVKCSKAIPVIASRKFYKATHEPSLSTLVPRPWLYNSWSVENSAGKVVLQRGNCGLCVRARAHTRTSFNLVVCVYRVFQPEGTSYYIYVFPSFLTKKLFSKNFSFSFSFFFLHRHFSRRKYIFFSITSRGRN